MLFRCLIVLAFIAGAAAPSAARTAHSMYCIAIAVEGAEKDVLAERFDEFARAAGLYIDNSHPMVRTYTREDVASPVDSSAMIDLEKMGPLGSILTYTPLRGSLRAELLDRLKQFVAESISPVYATRRCDEIEGFTPPVLYY
jgi:hypothetical protein